MEAGSSSKQQRIVSALEMLLAVGTEASVAFPPLKSCLGGIKAIIDQHQEYKDVGDKLDSLLPLVIQLKETLTGASGNLDPSESERRQTLRESLERIERLSRGLQEKSKKIRLLDKGRDLRAICRLLDQLKYAIMLYQVHQQQSMNDRLFTLEDNLESQIARFEHSDEQRNNRDALKSLICVTGAKYNQSQHRSCLDGTRTELLHRIIQWLDDFGQLHRMFWITGLAGTGKSTIVQTIAGECFRRGILGASFVCSASVISESRGDPRVIFPTLSHQLGERYHEFLLAVAPKLLVNTNMTHEPLSIQADWLMIYPLLLAGVETVIVIDALEDFNDESLPALILELGRIARRISKVKFFIASRPHPQIKNSFHDLAGIAKIVSLHDTAPDLVNNDIQLFLEHKLSGPAIRNRSDNWPTTAQLELLRNRAAGFFVFAAATVKLFMETSLTADELCTIIERYPDNTSREGKVKDVHGGSSLDSLCTSILRTSFPINDPVEDSRVRSVLTAAILSPPPPPSTICKAARLEMRQVVRVLELVYPLLEHHEDSDRPVNVFHTKSLSDFLGDPRRCPDKRFLCQKSLVEELLILGSLVGQSFLGLVRPTAGE